MKAPKVDTSGTEMAQKAVADAQTAANNLTQNFSADLGTENLSKVVAGGAADASPVVGTLKKKNSASGGLASSLGINV